MHLTPFTDFVPFLEELKQLETEIKKTQIAEIMNISQTIDHINERLIAGAGVDEIKELLRPFVESLSTEVVKFPAGTFLYRARKIDKSFNKNQKLTLKDLKHCKSKDKVKIGRVNRIRQPVFYCSLSKEPPFFELDLSNNDEVVLSFWQTSKTMTLINIGYTESVFEQYGAKRPIPFCFSNQTAYFPSASQEIFLNQSEQQKNELKEFFLRKMIPIKKLKKLLAKLLCAELGIMKSISTI